MKQAISQWAAGHLLTLKSVESEARVTRECTQKQLDDTKTAINKHVTQERQYAVTEDQRQRFLRSLKYSGMNERRTVIKDSHEETFHWVLKRPIEDLDTKTEPKTSDHEAPNLSYDLNSDDCGSDSSLDSDPSLVREVNYNLRWDYWISNGSSDLDASLAREAKWPNFVKWLESDDTKYWISGKPGSGKSTLVKFLIDNPETATALNQWRNGCQILSHFFWKLGGPAQQNLRGFWSSLAYQLLLNNRTVLEDILSNFATAGEKDELSDWSDKELREICLEVLGRKSQPLCIFLDGLDEIADSDGAPEIINAIDDIIKTLAPNVKVCFACRPEYRFKVRFAGVPELNIHLLTRRDMCQMVRSEISRHSSSLPVEKEQFESFPEQIERTLVDKADGVFIWLVLALKTLQIGFENGDSEGELLSRIEELPSGIENLYEDMWKRLGVSESTYKEKGAEYLNLAVRNQQLWKDYPHMDMGTGQPLLLGQIAIATHPILRTRLHYSSDDIDRRTLQLEYETTKHAIETRTSGLLEVLEVNGSLGDVLRNQVTFIHRTAFDYLTTTNHGSNILAACRFSPCQTHIHLVCGLLALNHRFAPKASYPDLETDGAIADLCWVLTHLDRAASYGSEFSPKSKVIDYSFELYAKVLALAVKEYKDEHLSPYIRTKFTSTVLGFGCLEPWVSRIIREKDQTPRFLSLLLFDFLGNVGQMLCFSDSSNKTGQGMDGFHSKYHQKYLHCHRIIQWLISLGASVLLDGGTESLYNPHTALNGWLATCAHSATHSPSTMYGWCLEILALLMKATGDPSPLISITGVVKNAPIPFLKTLPPTDSGGGSQLLDEHEHIAKPDKHPNFRNARYIEFKLKVTLQFCIPMLLGSDMEDTGTHISNVSILREFCNQVSKETLETPEEMYVNLVGDSLSSQASFCFLKNIQPDRPARAARLLERSRWLSLIWRLNSTFVQMTDKELDIFIRQLEEFQENGVLQPCESSLYELNS